MKLLITFFSLIGLAAIAGGIYVYSQGNKILIVPRVQTTPTITQAPSENDEPVSIDIAPEFDGATKWLNTPRPLRLSDSSGTITIVYFWRYMCDTCRTSHTFMSRVQERFGDKVAIVGIHSPQTDDEKKEENVQKELTDQNISYPVAMDNDMVLWQAYNVEFWPAFFIIDGAGEIREKLYGLETEDTIQQTIETLLKEQGEEVPIKPPVRVPREENSIQ
jgi:peroxiredoxin